MCFRFDALTELGAFIRTEFLCVSVLIVASGPRVKLASCKSALNPAVVYSTHRSTLCCFVVYSKRRFVVCLSVCHFVLVFFSPFSIAITSLGEERAILSAFCTFVRFVLVWICRFILPLGVWEGLRFVIVALPGLFSYLFLLRGSPASILYKSIKARKRFLCGTLTGLGNAYLKIESMESSKSPFYSRQGSYSRKADDIE